MSSARTPKEEFTGICNSLQGMKETLIVMHQKEALKVGEFTNRLNNLNDVRLSTLKTIEIAVETAIDLIIYNLSINKFDNLGYKVRHVLLTQPHFALDNLFTHICDNDETDNVSKSDKLLTQVETDTKTAQSKKHLGFQQKFAQIKKRISELKTIDKPLNAYTEARNSLHGNYIHCVYNFHDKSTKRDQYIVLNFETMKIYLEAVIKCIEIICKHFNKTPCIPERATAAFCHHELTHLGLLNNQDRFKFDEQKLKELGKKSIIAIASYPSIEEIEKNGIEKTQGSICVAAVKLKYNDLPLFIRELMLTKNTTEQQLEHLNFCLKQYEKISLVTLFSTVQKEDNMEETIQAIRKAMADCNNLFHGRIDDLDRIFAKQKNDKELFEEIENRPLFTILEGEIIFIEGDKNALEVSGILNIENGKNISLSLSIASAIAIWKSIYAMKSDEELCKGHCVHEPQPIKDEQ
jgi:hypothetical protein